MRNEGNLKSDIISLSSSQYSIYNNYLILLLRWRDAITHLPEYFLYIHVLS